MNNAYLKYLFKANRNLIIFLAVINLILIVFGNRELFFDNGIAIAATITMFECVIVPVYMLRFLYSKSGVDVYFALPLKRFELIVNNLIFMLIVIGAINFIDFLICAYQYLSLIGLVFYLVLSLVLIAFALVITCAVALKFNNLIDVGIGILAYILLPVIGYFCFSLFFDNYLIGIDAFSLIDSNYIFYPSIIIDSLRSVNEIVYHAMDFANWTNDTYIVLALGVISLFSLLLDINNYQAENAGMISTSYWGYPLIIGVSLISMLFLVFSGEAEIFVIVQRLASVLVAYLILNFIYKRKIGISKMAIGIFIIFILFVYGFQHLCIMTGGFGLNRSFLNSYDIKDIYIDYMIFYNEGDELYLYFTKGEKTISPADTEIIHDLQLKTLGEIEKNQDETVNGKRNYGYLAVTVNYADGYRYIYNISFDELTKAESFINRNELNELLELAKEGKLFVSMDKNGLYTTNAEQIADYIN